MAKWVAAKFVLMHLMYKCVAHVVGPPGIACGNFDTITLDEG